MKARKLLVMAVMVAAAAGLLLDGNTALAADKAASTDWKFHSIVDVEFVKQHIGVPMPEGVMLIDARPKRGKYDGGHIPGAVSISDSSFDKMKDQLPEDKATLLIYYCQGPTCKLSHKSAWKAEKLGYTNVKVFSDGFPAWMKVDGHYASVSVDWVKKQIDKGTDMVLVDSRPKRTKYDKGHIPGALSIPDTYFDKFKDQLPEDKSKLLVFYCGGFKCKLSHKSAAKAIAMGYTNVKVFAEGYPAWKKVAPKAETPAAAPALEAGKEEGTISHATFKQIVADKADSIYIYDVRDADEYATGSLPGAVNLPIDQLEGKLDSLPTDKPIVFICGTGARSGEAYYMIQDLKPSLKNIYYIDGEMTIHKDGTFELKESV